MIVDIAAPFIDTHPAALQLRLGLAALPAEATRCIDVDGAAIEFRLLAASHQVLFRADDEHLTETLGCLGDHTEQLPAEHSEDVGALHYAIDIRVEHYEAAEYTRVVTELMRDASERALVGRYRGDPLATTGIDLVAGGALSWGWRTWHSYPQTRQIVFTESSVTTTADRSPAYAADRGGAVRC